LKQCQILNPKFQIKSKTEVIGFLREIFDIKAFDIHLTFELLHLKLGYLLF
jgi:hypothetical protein